MHTKSVSSCAALNSNARKVPLIAILGLALASASIAAEQLIVVTPSTLDGWSVTGADKGTLASNPQLVLPAGSQLGQNFTGNAVILHLVSQPVLSGSSAEWPILTVGPAALAVVAQNGEGQLMLVVNESTLIELPWKIPASKTLTPLDLLLAYDPVSGAGLIAFQNETQAFEAGRSTQAVDVFLTAGANYDWPCEKLEVLLLGADSADPSATIGGRNGEASSKTADKLRSIAEQLMAGHDAGAVATTIPSVTTAGKQTGGAGPKLEVFTPPSVRRARTEAVRAIVAKSQKK